jgi:hypothetical protein
MYDEFLLFVRRVRGEENDKIKNIGHSLFGIITGLNYLTLARTVREAISWGILRHQ